MGEGGTRCDAMVWWEWNQLACVCAAIEFVFVALDTEGVDQMNGWMYWNGIGLEKCGCTQNK